MTRGSLWTSAGVPGGDRHAEVERHHPVGEVHDHVHVVLDEDHREVELLAGSRGCSGPCPRSPRGSCRPPARRAAAAAGPSPAPGPARCASGCRRAAAPTGWRRYGCQLEQVDDLLDRGRGGRSPRAGPCRTTARRRGSRCASGGGGRACRLSSTLRLANRPRFWNVRATPSCGDAVGPLADELVAVEHDRALPAGRYTPLRQLKIDVLPAPFGPMMANSSPRRDVEADVVERA